MDAKMYMEMLGYNMDAEENCTPLKDEFKKLIERVNASSLPEGNMMIPNTKEWLRFKLTYCVCGFSDEELEDEGLLPEWTLLVDKLV